MIGDIRQKAATGQYEYSKHAVDQTIKRDIKETYSEQHVTYTLEMDGKFYIVEHVPGQGLPGDWGTVFCPGDG